jgi:hypothetical protein
LLQAADKLYGPADSTEPSGEEGNEEKDEEEEDVDFEAQVARELKTLQARPGRRGGKQRLRSAKTNTPCCKLHDSV